MGHHVGTEGPGASKPNQKVSQLCGPFGPAVIILKMRFQNFKCS